MIRKNIVYAKFSDWQFRISEARGSFIWDENGRRLIDFTSGWNVTNLGWNHPEIHAAIKKQLTITDYAPGWLSVKIQEEYAQALVNTLPKELNSVCRATGGTEANEEAFKMAWAATGRKKIIGFTNSYHGHSLALMNLGYDHNFLKKVGPIIPEFIQLEFPKQTPSTLPNKTLERFLDQLETLLKKRDVAALVTEPDILTGWGSTFVAPKGFTKAIRTLTKEYGTLLVFDEVGTGFSRCGELYGMQLENVTPDIATFAKGISNGSMPIGAVAVRKDLAEVMIAKTNIFSTFGWTPLACAAALTTLNIHLRDKIWEKAAKDGDYLKTELESRLIEHPHIGEIRGIGMEIGLQCVKDKKTFAPDDVFAKHIMKLALDRGLFLCYGGDGNIQIMPPLTTQKSVLKEGLDILVDTVKAIKI